jgi:hypothetical protein
MAPPSENYPEQGPYAEAISSTGLKRGWSIKTPDVVY